MGALTCGINVHGNYYYMVEGALTCGSPVAINVHSNYYYMMEGSPHMWQLTCTVITTIWCRGALTCGSCVAINVHGNYYYMVEGLMCGSRAW